LKRISICTCCSKEEGNGELAPALVVHDPASLERGELKKDFDQNLLFYIGRD
jgi:hypothetical protein